MATGISTRRNSGTAQRGQKNARQNGLNYNKLIHGLKVAGIDLDRKVLADIALQDPAAFTQLAETAKKAATV